MSPDPTRSPDAPTLATRTGTAVRLVDVHKIYDGATPVAALRGVSLDFARGSLTAVMGQSGSGKSTLLNVAAGLDVPGGQGVAGSNPVVPTARTGPDELLFMQLIGPSASPEAVHDMICSARSRGPFGGPQGAQEGRQRVAGRRDRGSVGVQVTLCRGQSGADGVVLAPRCGEPDGHG